MRDDADWIKILMLLAAGIAIIAWAAVTELDDSRARRACHDRGGVYEHVGSGCDPHWRCIGAPAERAP